MPRYYFDCDVDSQMAEDEEDLELPSLDAVENEAVRSAMAIACDEFSPTGGNGVVVVAARDEQGNRIVTVTSSMTTTVEWKGSGEEKIGFNSAR